MRKQFILLISLWLAFGTGRAFANPQGLTVVSGSAHAVRQGNTVQITTSQNALLQWNSFNIAPGESTVFHEPSATSIVFNNINNANPTTIFGSLQANGIVVLENQSGFYFGPHAFVKAGGLVVTTAAMNPWASAGGAGWSFDGPPTAAPIVNYGHLETAYGGSLFLIAKQIENQGTISAPGGTAALVAGQEVLLSQRPNGLSLSAPVKLPAGTVDNQGKITADAGQVLLQAQTVNNSGVIQANSVREKNGVIELYASQEIQLAGSSVIEANGGGDGVSPGGTVAIKSSGTFSDSAGSQITAAGGANGGNGGKVEISAENLQSLNTSLDATANEGWKAGELLLDPTEITLGTTGASGQIDIDTAFQNFSTITLQASDGITLQPNTAWNLSTSTGKTTGQLTLEAGGSITLGNGSTIEDENNWSVTLEAGYNFTAGGGIISGTGGVANNVTLQGNAAIQTATGNVSIVAGNNVTVGTGGIVTGIANGIVMSGAGGNINVQAVAGNVNCGTSQAGYIFTSKGYTVDPNLGGISTASGGNVSITAGGNVTAVTTSGSAGEDAGTGAFGALPGSVTITAGGNVTGHYVVADGIGTIRAGGDAGTVNNNLALSLIKGAWVVNATDDIFLMEARNPNGMFNSSSSSYRFRFDYDPLASLLLDAGDSVTITGNGVPRTTANKLEGLIFPPSLTIEAGAGGITLDTSLSLFPSPTGSLKMTTTGGGDLASGNSGSTVTVCLSDSRNVQWREALDFTPLDPGNDVLHLNDPYPVLFTISGSVSDFNISSPKPVEMHVTGNIIDSSATIQNLHPTDTTVISAGGEIIDYSDYVIVTLPARETPNLNALDQVAAPYVNALTLLPDLNPNQNPALAIPNPNLNPTLENQQNQFTYDAKSGSVKYQGVMPLGVEQALLAMKQPFLDAATIKQIYAQSQLESGSSLQGYTVAGPGTFRINAGSIDLGNGGGIVSEGIDGHRALVPYTTHGANIDISVTGNLSMIASTIASVYGGDITIDCGGTIDVGSLLVPSTSDKHPLGIVSLWGGNVSVIANGDVSVDGSRIASYDGGNVFVESLTGNVDAGSGGSGAVLVAKPYVNGPGPVADLQDVIPGSGIMATSFPQLVPGETSSHLGNITVETPQGDIEASRGGIVQLALGPVAQNNATINLVAGSKNSDGSVAFVGNVDASGSGVIGSQVNISATGNIRGLVVASVGANVSALQNVSATVLSQGGATVSAGGTVSGTIVGVGSVSVSGASDVAAAFAGAGVTASGAQSGAAVAAAPTGSNSASAAATQQQVAQSTQANSTLADNGNDSDEQKKKRAQNSKLKEYVGRVTVILPE